jgi:hypothetical protein
VDSKHFSCKSIGLSKKTFSIGFSSFLFKCPLKFKNGLEAAAHPPGYRDVELPRFNLVTGRAEKMMVNIPS